MAMDQSSQLCLGTHLGWANRLHIFHQARYTIYHLVTEVSATLFSTLFGEEHLEQKPFRVYRKSTQNMHHTHPTTHENVDQAL